LVSTSSTVALTKAAAALVILWATGSVYAAERARTAAPAPAAPQMLPIPIRTPILAPLESPACLRTRPQVDEATNGTGVLYDPTCTTAYVLPPAVGTVTVATLAPDPNVQACPAVLKLHSQVDSVLAQVQVLEAKIATYLATVDRLETQLDTLGAQLADAAAASDAADQALAAAANDLAALEAQLQSAQISYQQCVATQGGAASCTVLQTGVTSAQAALDAFASGTYEPALAKSQAAQAAYDAVYSAYDDVVGELSDALDPIVDLVAEVATLNTTVLSTYDAYAALTGATGSLVFSVPWDALVSSYETANPKQSWSWRPATMDSARIFATANIGGDPTTVPGLLRASLPGDSADGGGDGDAGAALMRPGGSQTATIELSLVGACPYFPSGDASAPTAQVDQKGLAAYVSANVVYTYRVTVTATFLQALEISPLAAKLRLAGVDPLGPTATASRVRATVTGQAVLAETGIVATRHATLMSALGPSTAGITPSARTVAPSRMAPFAAGLPIVLPPWPIVAMATVERTGTMTFAP
jgi:hypothetical protein